MANRFRLNLRRRPRFTVVAEGDSITSAAGTYADQFRLANPLMEFYNHAVGGSGVATMRSRLPALQARSATHLSVLIGANDAGPGPEFSNDLLAYVGQARAVMAAGSKIAVATLLPQAPDEFENKRTVANAAIEGALGSTIDVIIPFASDPIIGTAAAGKDTSLYGDGLHPGPIVQARMLNCYDAVMKPLIARSTAAQPAAFTLPGVTAAVLNTDYIVEFWVTGLGASVQATATISGDGTFSVGQSAFSTSSKLVSNGSCVRVRIHSALVEDVLRTTTLQIGTRSATYGVRTLTSATTFTAPPVINTDGTPEVGEIVTFTNGSIANGLLGKSYLVLNGTQQGELLSSSFSLDSAGQVVVRQYLGNTATYSDSAPITVVAPTMQAISAPVLRFPADRTAGTNPPVIEFDAPDATVFATDAIEVRSGVNSNTSLNATETIAGTFEGYTAQSFDITSFGNFNAGPFYVDARFKRTVDLDGNVVSPAVYSPWSNVLSDTLGAKALPPATTTWDIANKSDYATLDEPARRTVTWNDYVGAGMPVAVTTARSDARFLEIAFVSAPGGTSGLDNTAGGVGIIPTSTQIVGTAFDAPTGQVSVEFPIYDAALKSQLAVDIPNGTAIMQFIIHPATSGNNGTLELRYKGVLVGSIVNHSLTSFKVFANTQRGHQWRLNTGQEAFSANAPTGILRYN